MRDKSDSLECGMKGGSPGTNRLFQPMGSALSTHRSIIDVTVIVNQALLLLHVEADPVMEASDLAFFDFTCNKESKVDDLFPFSYAMAVPPLESLTPRLFTYSASCRDFPASLASLTLTSGGPPFGVNPFVRIPLPS